MPVTYPRQAQVDAFLSFAQHLVDADHRRVLASFPKLAADEAYVASTRPVLSLELGRRYAKVVKSARGSRSVYCFLDLSSGDILKAESWRRPAAHPRGSLDRPEGWTSAVTAHGGAYLR